MRTSVRLGEALRRRHRIIAAIAVTARDAAGNARRLHRRVIVRR
jgi:hypothetical protein